MENWYSHNQETQAEEVELAKWTPPPVVELPHRDPEFNQLFDERLAQITPGLNMDRGYVTHFSTQYKVQQNVLQEGLEFAKQEGYFDDPEVASALRAIWACVARGGVRLASGHTTVDA